MRHADLAVIALVALLAGCHNPTVVQERQKGIAGTWHGVVTIAPTYDSVRVEFLLVDTATYPPVAGTAYFMHNGWEDTATIQGVYQHPDVLLDIGQGSWFQGTLTHADTIQGTLSGSGFRSADIVFRRVHCSSP